jgi:hypothetical protein
MTQQLEFGSMVQEGIENVLDDMTKVQNNITYALSIQSRISEIFRIDHIADDDDEAVKVSSDGKNEYIEYNIKKMKIGKFYGVRYQGEIYLFKRTENDKIESYGVI